MKCKRIGCENECPPSLSNRKRLYCSAKCLLKNNRRKYKYRYCLNDREIKYFTKKCLNCGNLFKSDSKYIRICLKCKSTSTYSNSLNEYNYKGVGRASGSLK